MESFDASVISTIPDRVQDPIANAVPRALTLANMLDHRKLNQFTLANAEKSQEDQADIQRIVKSGNYTTPQGYLKTASALTSAGHPQAAQNFMRMGQDYSSGNYQNQVQQLELVSKQQDIIAGGFDNVLQQVNSWKAAHPSADPDAAGVTRSLAIAEAKQLQSDHPHLTPQIQKFLQNPQNLTYAGIVELERQSNMGQKLLAQRRQDLQLGLAQQRQQVAQAGEAERERHDKAIESGGRYGITNPQTLAGQELKDEYVKATGGKVTLAQLRALNFDRLASQGATADSLVQGALSYTGRTRAASAVGQRAGSVSILEGSIAAAADQVRQALAGVDRTQLPALNKAIAAGKKQFGDAHEARYATTVNGIINEYSRVISGGTGASTDSARAEARAILNTAQTPEQVNAVLDQIQRETQIVEAASQRAMSGGGAASSAGQRTQSGATVSNW